MLRRLMLHLDAWLYGRELSNEALFAFCAAEHYDDDPRTHECWVTVELQRRWAKTPAEVAAEVEANVSKGGFGTRCF